MGLLKKFTDASKRAGAALAEANKAAQIATAAATAKAAANAQAAIEKKLAGPTNNFTKAMVVRTYTAKETQIMEDEGSVLLEHGYTMQGQSGFAENKGESWTSIKSANRSKGTTTITYVKIK